MSRTTLRVAFAAGRFDADAHEVASYLDDTIRRHRLDLVLTTESQQRGIGSIVRTTLGPTFGVQKRGECMAIWRRSALTRRDGLPAALWHLSVVRGLIGWRQMRAAVFRLTLTVTKTPLNAAVSHTPSGVQSGDHWDGSHPRQVRASKTGHRRLGNRLRRAADARPRLLQIVGEDSNLDQHRAVWRDFIATRVGHSAWAVKRPERGSHGKRLIDVIAWVAGHDVHVSVEDAGVSPVTRPPGYDHALVWAVLRIETP